MLARDGAAVADPALEPSAGIRPDVPHWVQLQSSVKVRVELVDGVLEGGDGDRPWLVEAEPPDNCWLAHRVPRFCDGAWAGAPLGGLRAPQEHIAQLFVPECHFTSCLLLPAMSDFMEPPSPVPSVNPDSPPHPPRALTPDDPDPDPYAWRAEMIRTVRDEAGLRALLDVPDGGGEPNLYALVPVGSDRGGRRPKAPRSSREVYPGPALPAEVMAARLQLWLQGAVSGRAVLGSTHEVALGMVDAVPALAVTAADVECVALQDGSFEDADSDAAYRTWCVRSLGVRLVRPDVLYAWSTECSDFWALETLQAAVLRSHNVHVLAEDVANAAGQAPCRDHAAQAFFDAQAVRGSWLVAARNLSAAEVRQRERDGPYFAWERGGGGVLEAAAVVPWDGVASGADFAYRLQYAFSVGHLKPALGYSRRIDDDKLPYVADSPEEPDESLVARLSRGEWADSLEPQWGVRVVRVDVYAWVIEPPVCQAVQTERGLNLPSTLDRFTAGQMAADMSHYFNVDVDAASVEAAAEYGSPAAPAVRAAWEELVASVRAVGSVLGIQRL